VFVPHRMRTISGVAVKTTDVDSATGQLGGARQPAQAAVNSSLKVPDRFFRGLGGGQKGRAGGKGVGAGEASPFFELAR